MTDIRSDRSASSEQALTFSGILVTGLVGAVGAFTVYGTAAFPYAAVLAATQLLLFLAFIRQEQGSLQTFIFWSEALCIGSLLFLIPSSFIVILTVVWLVQAVELYGVRRSAGLIAASLGLFLIAQLSHFGIGEWFQTLVSIFLYGLLQVFAVSAVQRTIDERERREQVAALNRELIATRELLSQSSAQNERLRIARDLHDILGHHMTALILNLEVASHGVEGQPKEKVEQSLALAKLLLSDLRNTVSELREDSPIQLEESVRKLVAGIPGFAIDVDFSEAPAIDDVDMAETLLRCTQEGVTNVLRHSNGDRCQITMRGTPAQCSLSISDNGRRQASIEPGNGLKGMLERVRARGGDLVWQQNEEGFKLQVTLGAEAPS